MMGNWFMKRGMHLRGRLAVVAVAVVPLVALALVSGGGGRAKPVVAAPPSRAASAPDAGFSVSAVGVDGNGNVDVAALGPGGSLLAYWEIAGTWYGPLSVNGPGTSFSAPKLILDHNNNLDLAVQGPDNSLWVYWQIAAHWYGPLGIGPTGSTFSTPSATSEPDGTLDVSVQGPSHSLLNFWEISGTWYGPYGVGAVDQVSSPPSDSSSTTTGYGYAGGHAYVTITAQAANNELVAYQSIDGTWQAPQFITSSQVFSAPATLSNDSTYNSWFDGPGNSLGAVVSGSFCEVSGSGTVFSAPGFDNVQTYATVGVANSLYVFWYTSTTASCSKANGPLGIGSVNSDFSVPTIVMDHNGNDDIAVEGPGNSLWVFWDVAGTWYGPLGVGSSGSTFTSPD